MTNSIESVISHGSKLIRLSDATYPLSLDDVRQSLPNSIIPDKIFVSALRELGFDVVHEVARPSGDVVIEIQPELNNEGVYLQTWSVRSFTTEELTVTFEAKKEAILNEIEQRLTDLLEEGVTVEILPDVFDIVRLQEGDVSNITATATNAVMLSLAGIDGKLLVYRSKTNAIHTLSPLEYQAFSQRVGLAGQMIYQRYWAKKDFIRATEYSEEVVLDSEF